MLNLSLLNFWLENIDMYIKDNILYLLLKACDRDCFKSYKIKLSDNSDEILKFFGFDITRDYHNMTKKNQFVFLTTSTKLKPELIKYISNGFKGPNRSYSKLEEKFNAFLKEEYYLINPIIDVVDKKLKFRNDAISTFHIQDKYEIYVLQYTIMNKLMEQRKKILEKIPYDEFTYFVMLYSIYTVVNSDDKKLLEMADEYNKLNWNFLKIV